MNRSGIAGLSAAGAALVAALIGMEGIVTEAMIPVPGDVPTIGVGHTEGVRLGDKIDRKTAIEFLKADVTNTQKGLAKCIKADLSQGEFDAFSSLAFNVGVSRVCRSSIPKLLDAGDYAGACKKITEFVCGPATEKTRAKPGERCYLKTRPLRVVQGLVNRRQVEYKMCVGEGNG